MGGWITKNMFYLIVNFEKRYVLLSAVYFRILLVRQPNALHGRMFFLCFTDFIIDLTVKDASTHRDFTVLICSGNSMIEHVYVLKRSAADSSEGTTNNLCSDVTSNTYVLFAFRANDNVIRYAVFFKQR